MSAKTSEKRAPRRKRRIRGKLRAARPSAPACRVFRSNKAIYAQIIDDSAGVTLAAARSAEVDGAG